MTRYAGLVGGVVATLLSVFLVLEAAEIATLEDPATVVLREPAPRTALIGVGLLTVDAAVPVPSSLVMLAHGALFGVAGGAALSTIGGLGALLVGYSVGRLAARRARGLVSPTAWTRADAFFRRWGAIAIVLSRPVPLAAETVAVLAGASLMPIGRVVFAATAALLPLALVYSLAGAATVASSLKAIAPALVVAVAAVAWVGERALTARFLRSADDQTETSESGCASGGP